MSEDHIWYPYTQMADAATADARFVVTHGEGVYVHTRDGRKLLDGYSQMWCNALGHANKRINAALSAQADKIAHSSLFSASNETSLELASMVVGICRDAFVGDAYSPDAAALVIPTEGARNETRSGGTSTTKERGSSATFAKPHSGRNDELEKDFPKHVFFSDNGSTAVESGLKMALQYHRNQGEPERKKLLCFADAYHGDTAATMTLGGVELFRKAYEAITFEVLRAPYPMQANRFDPPCAEETTAYEAACKALRETFSKEGKNLAAVVIEPGVQGAGGMRPCHAGFLPLLRELCDEYGVLLIADEVMTAFGRAGETFACAAEGVTPDIICLAKALTAGYIPLALTVAVGKVYNAFLGEYGEFKHLFHGHTFTGNQLGGAVAIETLKVMRDIGLVAKISRQQALIEERLQRLSGRSFTSFSDTQEPECPEVNLSPKGKIESRRAEGDFSSGLRDSSHRGGDAQTSDQSEVGDTNETTFSIGRIRQRGFVMGIPLVEAGGDDGYTGLLGKRVCARALELGAIIRPLGNVVVLMPILASTDDELHELFDILEQALEG